MKTSPFFDKLRISHVKSYLMRLENEKGEKIQTNISVGDLKYNKVFKNDLERVWKQFKERLITGKKSNEKEANLCGSTEETDINALVEKKTRPSQIITVSFEERFKSNQDAQVRIEEIKETLEKIRDDIQNIWYLEHKIANTIMILMENGKATLEAINILKQHYDFINISNDEKIDSSKTLYIHGIVHNRSVGKEEFTDKWYATLSDLFKVEGALEFEFRHFKYTGIFTLQNSEDVVNIKESIGTIININNPILSNEEVEISCKVEYPVWNCPIEYHDIAALWPTTVDLRNNSAREKVEQALKNIYKFESLTIKVINQRTGIIKTKDIDDSVQLVDTPKCGLEKWILDYAINHNNEDSFMNNENTKTTRKDMRNKEVKSYVNQYVNKKEDKDQTRSMSASKKYKINMIVGSHQLKDK